MKYWIDKRATGARTGAPDESPDANGIYQNAWRSFREYWDNKASVTTSDSLNVAPGSGPYEELFHISAAERIYSATDISFDAASGEIRQIGIAATLSGVIVGNILRIKGSNFNDKQIEVAAIAADAITVASTNNLTDEAAGASIDLVKVEYSDQCTALDLGKNGTSVAAPMKLNMNENRMYGGIRVLPGNTKYRWNPSVLPNCYYLTMADGSNPSLMFDNPNYCLVCDGYFTHASAGDSLRQMAANPAALTFNKQGTVGDADSLGFNTVYFYAESFSISQVEVVIPQAKIGFNLLWRYWEIDDTYIFAAQETCIKANAQRDCIIRRPVMAYADQSGLFDTTTVGYSLTVESPITYFTGHRGWLKTSTGDLSVYNHLDVGSHLGWKIASSASGSVINEDWTAMYNESAAFHYQLGNTVTLTMHNYFAYPAMIASGGIAYLVGSDHRSSATGGFDTTSATAFPASTILGGATMNEFSELVAALEATKVGAGAGPQPVNIDLNTFENCDFKLPESSPCIAVGYKYWGTDPNPLGNDKIPFMDVGKDLWVMQSQYSQYSPSNT